MGRGGGGGGGGMRAAHPAGPLPSSHSPELLPPYHCGGVILHTRFDTWFRVSTPLRPPFDLFVTPQVLNCQTSALLPPASTGEGRDSIQHEAVRLRQRGYLDLLAVLCSFCFCLMSSDAKSMLGTMLLAAESAHGYRSAQSPCPSCSGLSPQGTSWHPVSR